MNKHGAGPFTVGKALPLKTADLGGNFLIPVVDDQGGSMCYVDPYSCAGRDEPAAKARATRIAESLNRTEGHQHVTDRSEAGRDGVGILTIWEGKGERITMRPTPDGDVLLMRSTDYDNGGTRSFVIPGEAIASFLDQASISTAISDPGLYVDRGPDDSLLGWQARAVRRVLVEGNDVRAPCKHERTMSAKTGDDREVISCSDCSEVLHMDAILISDDLPLDGQ